MRNKLCALCLALLLLAAFPLTAAAQGFDPDQLGSISVTLASGGGESAMAGAELSVYHVADVELNPEGKLVYLYTEAFAQCGVPLDGADLALRLDAYVAEHPVEHRTIVTDAQGNAVCQNLPLGLYLIRQAGAVEGFAPCAPFLVTVPFVMEDGYDYHVDASPKTDVARLIDLTIRKVWNADDPDSIPRSVTVQLFRGQTLVDTVVLNGENDWRVTFRDLPESDAYRVEEVDVPEGFLATYSRNGYTFTVTNTSSLPQTGQLIWPIPVFAMAGIVLILVGFAILRKSGNRDE